MDDVEQDLIEFIIKNAEESDIETETNIVVDEKLVNTWSTETRKFINLEAKIDDINDEITSLDISNLDTNFQELIDFFDAIIQESQRLEIRFGSEKYDTEDSTTERIIKSYHPDVTSDLYESGLEVNSISTTTYNQDNLITLINFIINYDTGGEDSDKEDFITTPVKVSDVSFKDYRVELPVAYLNKEVRAIITPMIVLPNIASSISSDATEDPNNKLKIFPVSGGYSNLDLLSTVVFLKMFQLIAKEVLFLLIGISSQSLGLSVLKKELSNASFDEATVDNFYTLYTEKKGKLSLVDETINRLRQHLMGNIAIRDIMKMFDTNEIEVFQKIEVKDFLSRYKLIKSYILSNKPLIFNGYRQKNIITYFPTGTFTTKHSESVSYSPTGGLEKSQKTIETIPTNQTVVQNLRPINRRINVKPSGVISTARINVDSDVGKVYREIQDEGFIDAESGDRVRSVSLQSPNWDDCIAVSRQLNDRYGTLVYRDVSGVLYGQISAGFFQSLIHSSINFSFNFDNSTQRGGMNFRSILRRE